MIVDLREYVLRVGKEKTKFCITKIIRSAHHLIKHVTVAKEGVNRCREEKLLVLDAETDDRLADEVPICMTTGQVIGKPTIIITERLLFVPESKEAPVGEATGGNELVANTQNVGMGRKNLMD